jgi:hypothetical protein
MRAIGWRMWFGTCLLLLAPSTIRAESRPDLTSPKKAATAFALGLQAGDIDQVRASSTGADSDYKLMQKVASTMASVHKLHDAAVSRFGIENAKKLETGVTDNGDVAGRLKQAMKNWRGIRPQSWKRESRRQTQFI